MAVSSTARGGFLRFIFAAATTAGMCFMREIALATLVSFGSRDCVRMRKTLSLIFQMVIETMVAQRRGFGRMQREPLIKVTVEKSFQWRVRSLNGSNQRSGQRNGESAVIQNLTHNDPVHAAARKNTKSFASDQAWFPGRAWR
jgi:hypothetical protein